MGLYVRWLIRDILFFSYFYFSPLPHFPTFSFLHFPSPPLSHFPISPLLHFLTSLSPNHPISSGPISCWALLLQAHLSPRSFGLVPKDESILLCFSFVEIQIFIISAKKSSQAVLSLRLCTGSGYVEGKIKVQLGMMAKLAMRPKSRPCFNSLIAVPDN